MDDPQILLDSLANTHLPALPSEPAEPVEPKEVSVEDRGRSPDEVVEPREARLPAADKEEETRPAKREEKLYEVRGVKYTAKELEKAGLLEDLAVTHGKHQHLQERYNELLKSAVEKPVAQLEAPKQITNALIARTYDPFASQAIKELIDSNLIEADLPEAYPRGVQTLIGQLRFVFDLIFSMQEKLDQLAAKDSVNQEKVQGQIVQNVFNQQLDALAAKDAKLYGGLKDPKSRIAFANFLVSEVGATIGQVTGEKAGSFLAKQWIAFNADSVIDAAKNGVRERKNGADKRPLIMGEGAGSRHGLPETGELSVLDRMIQQSGKISE